MSLETATFIHDLVPSNPAHTDPLSAADSHIRLIKLTLQNTFPNLTDAALVSTQAQIDAATAQAAGTSASVIPKGTAPLPGLAVLADLGTGIWQPAAGQLAFSISGVQTLLMGSTAIATSLAFAAPAIAASGAYSGGTGQLVPIGSVHEWYDDVLPVEGGYVWCNGQAISRTSYPILFARWGSRFGAGDGSTTFNVPDRRQTVGVGRSTMGGVSARGSFSVPDAATNAVSGEYVHTLTTAEMPSHFHAAAIFDPGHTHGVSGGVYGPAALTFNYASGGSQGGSASAIVINTATTGVRVNSSNGIDNTYSTGSSASHNNMQPSTSCNYILRAA